MWAGDAEGGRRQSLRCCVPAHSRPSPPQLTGTTAKGSWTDCRMLIHWFSASIMPGEAKAKSMVGHRATPRVIMARLVADNCAMGVGVGGTRFRMGRLRDVQAWCGQNEQQRQGRAYLAQLEQRTRRCRWAAPETVTSTNLEVQEAVHDKLAGIGPRHGRALARCQEANSPQELLGRGRGRASSGSASGLDASIPAEVL